MQRKLSLRLAVVAAASALAAVGTLWLIPATGAQEPMEEASCGPATGDDTRIVKTVIGAKTITIDAQNEEVGLEAGEVGRAYHVKRRGTVTIHKNHGRPQTVRVNTCWRVVVEFLGEGEYLATLKKPQT